jgi:zinc protease
MIAALVIAAALATSSRAIETFTLANGIRVYVERMRSRETVILGTVALSPAFDPPGKEGTGAIASAALHAQSDDTFEYGAHFGAHVPATRIGSALDTLAANARSTTFEDATVAALIEEEKQDLAQRNADAGARASRAFDRAIYGNADPVVRTETPQTLAAISAGDVRAYVQRTFVPQNTSIIVAGDVDPRALRTMVMRSFGTWKRAAAVPTIALPNPPQTLNSVTVIGGTDAVDRVRIGQAALGRRDPDFYALNIANAVISARLTRALPNASATSSLLTTRERGVIAVDMSVPAQELNTDRGIVKTHIARLITERIPAAEWNAARTRLLASPALHDAAQPAAVGRLQNLALNALPVTYFDRLASYYAVTPEAGLAAARRHLRADAFAEVIVTSAAPQSAPPIAPSP